MDCFLFIYLFSDLEDVRNYEGIKKWIGGNYNIGYIKNYFFIIYNTLELYKKILGN